MPLQMIMISSSFVLRMAVYIELLIFLHVRKMQNVNALITIVAALVLSFKRRMRAEKNDDSPLHAFHNI